MAERVGFEPTIRLSHMTSREPRLRPLAHLSTQNNTYLINNIQDDIREKIEMDHTNKGEINEQTIT